MHANGATCVRSGSALEHLIPHTNCKFMLITRNDHPCPRPSPCRTQPAAPNKPEVEDTAADQGPPPTNDGPDNPDERDKVSSGGGQGPAGGSGPGGVCDHAALARANAAEAELALTRARLAEEEAAVRKLQEKLRQAEA